MPWAWRLPVSHHLPRSLHASLARLQLPFVDLFQIASLAPSWARLQWLADSLADVYEKGLVKAVGIGNSSAQELKQFSEALAKRNVPCFSNQVEYSLLRRHPETCGLIESCRTLDIKPMAFSPLGMGRLTGKYTAENPPPLNRRFGNRPLEEVLPLVEKLRQIGDRRNKTAAQVAINYVMCKGVVPVVGVRTAAQVRENAGAIGWNLSRTEIDELDTVGIVGKTNISWQHG
eukprot:c14941_g1_i3.p1 GENE.c14941_g1_i3~~c14941_g1_i3.p1  ORF type:complete len:231 (+),score=32.03 c14941_g1_i3:455-1147(+)